MQPSFASPGVLPVVRFWLGLNLVLFALYLFAPLVAPGSAVLTPRGILESFALTAAGLALGRAYGRYWPLPARPGFVSVIRMLLLAIPAVGLSVAIGLLLLPQAAPLSLALSAFLGAQLRRRNF
ncbi:hypothetical protein [Deinococcus peraridilitoris]|uniref:Uncharacterized protein n=1 Tax=Deinococcus peraridilitoris (strain DSM 19664 / LMG 22246 / CIP 109416 / KR-200) TaxID=937777 RepID=L0A598_DEIPD|nr:hypothetical protein [Deinococcus peraridilitoris]AFZ69046.1 hypothetical protein Deipe_3618 [Deinococcus peraridilitoris DSM 19664]